MTRRTLLFVSPRFLFPNDEGGKIRTANILRCMKGGAFDVTLASPAPPDSNHYQADIAATCDKFLFWPAKKPSFSRRILALLDSKPVSVATDRSNAGSRVVAEALNQRPDVILADFPHACVLLPEHMSARSVMFTHNIETEIFERHAAREIGLRRVIWQDQARKMARFERKMLQRFDRVIAVSPRDAEMLKSRFSLGKVDCIDTGVDLDFFHVLPASDAPAECGGTIVFTGVMDSPANSDGVRFLMEEVWPLVTRKRPNAKAIIVGRNPPRVLMRLAHERDIAFEFTGYVDDVRAHVSQAHVAVIPLRVGSGTRIKAFEAMAMGRPVISTRIGVEGLDVKDEEHLLLADDAKSFAEAILRLLDDGSLRKNISHRARLLLENQFSWNRVARQFEEILLRAIGGN